MEKLAAQIPCTNGVITAMEVAVIHKFVGIIHALPNTPFVPRLGNAGWYVCHSHISYFLYADIH